jgi:hypothetical protein
MKTVNMIEQIADFSKLKQEVLYFFEKYRNDTKQVVLQTTEDNLGNWTDGSGRVRKLGSEEILENHPQVDEWLNSSSDLDIVSILENIGLDKDRAGHFINHYRRMKKKNDPDPVTKDKVNEIILACGTYVEREYKFIQPELEGTLIAYYLEKYKVYRSRIMLMSPRSCYSVHRDSTQRIHIPIVANPQAWMVWPFENQCYRFEEGNVYQTDTTKLHSFFNGSEEDRIHMVCCL